MEIFNLEQQFKFYLQTAKLDPNSMSKIQLQETKRAFFAGLAQMWKIIINIGKMKEENCDAVFDDIENQIAIFWLDKTITTETRKNQSN
jgi:deoxyribose-phosphate aldolase